MTRLLRKCGFALAAATFAAAPALAQDVLQTAVPVKDAPQSNSLFGTVPLSENALQAQAGREDVAMIAQSHSNASVAQNSIGNNSVTGEIRVTDQAFQNLSGLSLLNINSGNNVAINASMNVNISITQGQ